MTRQEYTFALQTAAKDLQGDNYAGDEYYDQDAWDEHWEEGVDPREAVFEEMSYWDS